MHPLLADFQRESTSPPVGIYPQRIASVLLTKLGIHCQIELPSRLDYRPLGITDILKLKRGFLAEVADEAISGWTDQGPNADQRRLFHDHSVILRVSGRAYQLDFLQASACTSATHQASYIVEYANDSHFRLGKAYEKACDWENVALTYRRLLTNNRNLPERRNTPSKPTERPT